MEQPVSYISHLNRNYIVFIYIDWVNAISQRNLFSRLVLNSLILHNDNVSNVPTVYFPSNVNYNCAPGACLSRSGICLCGGFYTVM